ncbi:DNA mismatch repair protein MutS [Kozakia baliensis]|uniref:DNA mismatch repair protein MutS n=1 Tax=Kozakia baliensis TaxID=153496 RepID=A0A1D8UXL3_9PROT|nr:DNA mismatch repair protein MutS [Kozakia baliensis]AOX18403.1 hypothetical protein A0U89_13870 [Kozakia baliensis]GBR34145.1 DNA mismatch repair protein MutS [Kozakia baliensis NRIC 0488]GEL65157.1 DNA mismatch repair protein MutS [Kozakia baliensis]
MEQQAQAASPMVTAYRDLKARHPDFLVFYRVGEFYEILETDATRVSQMLGLQLTRRRQKDAPDIPMCGVPSGRAEEATERLLRAGYHVALSEQPEEPGGDRPLRLLTPGTSVQDAVLDARAPNGLVALYALGAVVGLAAIDLSTGETMSCAVAPQQLSAALARTTPREIVVAQWQEGGEEMAKAVRASGVPVQRRENSEENLPDLLQEAYPDPALLRGLSEAERAALGSLLSYTKTMIGRLPTAMLSPRRLMMGDVMEIDAPTLQGLEILTDATGRCDGALLHVLDRSVTAAGTRLLVRQLAAPLANPEQIRRRLSLVRHFVENPRQRGDCREALGAMPDVLRAAGRLSVGKATPLDLGTIRNALGQACTLAEILSPVVAVVPGLKPIVRDLEQMRRGDALALRETLRRALTAQPERDIAGFVKSGFDRELDAARRARDEVAEALTQLQAQLAEQTGVRSLKIRRNALIGFHIEVPAAQASGLTSPFVLRQGLASSARFTHPALDDLAAKTETASTRIQAIEEALFKSFVQQALVLRDGLARMAHAAAALDLVAGLAQAAAEGGWVEPTLDHAPHLDIEQGRHPLAENLLEADGRTFEANDCVMSADQRLWMLTGPNMAGKSTFLRQVAVIVIMAQIGSFVPARQARIGIVDRLFSRIGAGDRLVAGQSTFMVEMLETAAILTRATHQSLVILDEVGRGTSTHDGLAIAQAVMEYLHDTIQARALFATHFHELAVTATPMPHAVCMRMDDAAGRHDELFTYKVLPGIAAKSFGLKIAALAGIPTSVIERARYLLQVR